MSEREAPAPQHYERIIIVGGGCYGSYYVRQLQRAASAGAIVASALTVVDRDAACALATSLARPSNDPIPVEMVVDDWRDFFRDYLTRAAEHPESFASDAIVPSPLMPHLMAEWLVDRARARWPERSVATAPIDTPLDVRWQRSGVDGTHYVSFADWTCPVNCVEPRTCPHTRGPRDWSLPPTVATYARDIGARSAVMHCRHRAYGVGMFDTAEVIAADDAIGAIDSARGGSVLIGTASHCHGALTRLVIPSGAAKSK